MMKSYAADNSCWPAFLCLLGIALYMVLSDPLLNSLGFHYSGEEGGFYEKLHPGTLFIFASFALLFLDCDPIGKFLFLAKEQKVFWLLLAIDMLAFLYMAASNGMAGLAFFIDTHMGAVICAIVLRNAPEKLCRGFICFFIAFALINSLVGVGEAFCHCRIFEFNPDWAPLHETYFRASAFIGHPLDNALFTAIAFFVMLAMGYPKFVTSIAGFILFAGLLAFGGRMAFTFANLGVALLVMVHMYKTLTARHASLLHIIIMLLAVMIVSFLAVIATYIFLQHGVGERIHSSINWDASADSRVLAFKAFSYLHEDEIFFGASVKRIMDIIDQMSSTYPLLGIENPWILIFMHMGIIVFPFWCAATIAFAIALAKHKHLPLQLTVFGYFLVASTANSFGRKDTNYAIMVCTVIAAARALISSNTVRPVQLVRQ